ncbi:pyridoxamine 5'-phosphate oxidase family protein [Catenulispora yoronensis]|uniref:Pyridoxamine 5'-phosphate oxidase family protein n=1 Tax=Catenulispora yoronensis TaxID=450799 RepID=A0ABN2VB61_9ACTN
MATWKQFEESAPGLASAVKARFTATKHHVLATLRRDGGPRVSGTEVDFDTEGRLRLGSMADAVKGRDLKRDGRFALHANPGDGTMDGGDSKISGVAGVVPSEGSGKGSGEETEEGSDLFDLDIREIVHTTVENNELVIRSWTPAGGEREVRRK